MAEPKVRFKKDDGSSYPAWKTSSFSETFIALNNNTYSRDMLNYNFGDAKNIHYGDILVKFGDICDIQKDIIPYVKEGLAIQKYASLKDGDIILADTAEDETVGKAVEIYNTKNDVVISGLHTMACRPVNSFAPKYLGYCMNSPAFHNQLRPFMQGVKVTSIGRSNISEVEISAPSSIEEQQKIADFLSSVDDVITASEEEVANLETQKKAVMKKIFSQEVRFKKADGTDFPEWEEKVFTDVAQLINGRAYSADEMLASGKYMILRVGNLFSNNEYYYSDMELDDDKYIDEGDLIYAWSATFGPRIYHGEKCIYHYHIWKVIPYSIEKDYFLHFLYADVDNLQSELNGQAYPSINTESFSEIMIGIPCIEEQHLIADFLSDFDEAIAAAKKELELWKELKKGLLQQMFV